MECFAEMSYRSDEMVRESNNEEVDGRKSEGKYTEGEKSVAGVREKEQARIGIGGQKKTPFRWKLEGKEKEKLGWAP